MEPMTIRALAEHLTVPEPMLGLRRRTNLNLRAAASVLAAGTSPSAPARAVVPVRSSPFLKQQSASSACSDKTIRPYMVTPQVE